MQNMSAAIELDVFNSNLFNNYENQTNNTICKIMNDFLQKYKKNFKDTVFILEYQNDIYSTIAYRILKNLQGVNYFNFKIQGTYKSFKQEINPKDSYTIFNRIKLYNKKKIYISCFNPIYNVEKSRKCFREMRTEDFYIINRFTPEQFDIMCNFFNINKNIGGNNK